MSKPRTQTEIEQWNAGARQADAEWWHQPHERGPGTTYERVRTGAQRTASGGISKTFEQQEKTRQP